MRDSEKKAGGRIFIGIGANLTAEGFASPKEGCLAALDTLAGGGDIAVVAVSPWYRTAPWPKGSDAPWYDNAVAEITTLLSPEALLAALHACEARFGRVRAGEARNAPRVLDLDLIDYGGVIRAAPQPPPCLPHPRAHERGFVLYPLADLAPDWVHPVSRKPIAELITALPRD